MAQTKAKDDRRFGFGRWLRRALRLAAVAVVLLALAVAAANVLVRRSVGPYLHADLRTAAGDALSAPVAIVPGASIHRDGTPSPQVEDRLTAARDLVRAGRVQRVLVSGARHGAYDEAGPMRRWLIQQGIPRDAVTADHAGFRTLDTMERAARVFGVNRAVVCTQAFHLPRAVFLARRAGIAAQGLAADGRSGHVALGDHVREALATLMAVVDSYLLRRQPRVLGPAMPLD